MKLSRGLPTCRVVLLWSVLACVGSVSVEPLLAQPSQARPVPGFQRDRAYFALLPFESIDTASGNVILTFTDWALPGYNGLDLVFQRTFNSASRWTFGLAGFPMTVLNPDGPGDPADPNGTPVFLTADGASHPTWWDGDLVTPTFWTANFSRYHVDGRRLELPNGFECTYDALGALAEVRDRFANRLEIVNESYGSQRYPILIRQHLGDGHIRELVLTYATVGTGRLLTSATFEGRTWTYQYGGAAGTELLNALPPAGPGWAFIFEDAAGMAPTLTVTVPQGGQLVYSFIDVPPSDPRWGMLLQRATREGSSITSQWSLTWQDEATTPPAYRVFLDGPENVRLAYGYETGPADTREVVLGWREIWDSSTGVRFERENRTYVTTQVTDISGNARNLLSGITILRGDQTYTTLLSYRAGDSTGRFADYGRPWTVREIGDAGMRDFVTTFDYSISGHLLDRIAAVSLTAAGETHTQTWTHNTSTGFVQSATRSGITTTYTADTTTGAVSMVTDAHGHATTVTYDWGAVKSVATPMHTTTRAINSDGTVASETRRGATTQFEYDALGRVRWVKPPLGDWIETRYDNVAARWVQARRGDGFNLPSETTTFLDLFGRGIGAQNSLGITTRVAYDALGRKVYGSLPYTATDVGSTFAYDVLGRLRSVQAGDGTTVTYAYSNGIDVTVTDQEGRVTVHDWAAFGSPDDARLMGVRDAANQVWTYSYNALGRLTHVHQPGAPSREWQYAGDLLVREVHPESGETTYTYQGGRLATRTTARGTVTFGYDANDRLIAVDAPGTAHDITLAYDESDNRTLVQNSYVRSAFEFDLANRPVRRRDTIAGQPERETVYAYDGADRVASITYPSGTIVGYMYDREGRVTSITRGPNAVLVAQVLDYHPSGAPGRLRFANGIEETYAYDPFRYRLQQIGGGPLQLTYGYDGVGNVVSIADGRPQFNQTFGYDTLNRLRWVAGWAPNEFQYDPLGNRTSKSLPAVTYNYDPASKRLTSVSGAAQLPEAGQYVHDAVGNLTSDPTGTYTYTPFNLLETATVAGQAVTYRYDGHNQRRVRVLGDRTDFFVQGLGNRLLSEYTQPAGAAEASWVRDYLYLGSRVVAALSRP
jgi:YD repeat-containing protein